MAQLVCIRVIAQILHKAMVIACEKIISLWSRLVMCHIPAHNALYPTLHRRQPYKFAPVQVCDPDLSIAMPLAKWRIKLLAAVCTAVAVLLVVSLFSSIPTEETEYSYKDGVICPKVGYTLALSYQDQMTSVVVRMAALHAVLGPSL